MSVIVEPRPSTASAHTTPLVPAPDAITVALVNNMPDSVLEGTEAQFRALLDGASGTSVLRLRYSALPHVPRGESARADIAARYWPLAELLRAPPDAIIVTGTEPRAPRLRDEPYWPELVELLDWAQRHTASSVWSCLAAHAAVLHLDEIERHRLPVKRCGVYAHSLAPSPLTTGLNAPFYTPHSRWNDLRPEALRAAGYQVLSESPETGADVFAKDSQSLMVFLQGHPEYDARALLKEFQRDVSRFLSGQQPNYPAVPAGYFSPGAQPLLEAFREQALAQRDPAQLKDFPYTALAADVVNKWRPQALAFYANWLRAIAERRAQSPASGRKPVSSRR